MRYREENCEDLIRNIVSDAEDILHLLLDVELREDSVALREAYAQVSDARDLIVRLKPDLYEGEDEGYDLERDLNG